MTTRNVMAAADLLYDAAIAARIAAEDRFLAKTADCEIGRVPTVVIDRKELPIGFVLGHQPDPTFSFQDVKTGNHHFLCSKCLDNYSIENGRPVGRRCGE